jgi:hypothetical protein
MNMVGKITTRSGHVDKHRHSISGIKAEETQKWGQETAYSRYGKPSGQHETEARGVGPQHPQQPENRHDVNYDNDTSGWIRAEGETGEKRPNYIKGYRVPDGDDHRDGSVEDQGGPPLRTGHSLHRFGADGGQQQGPGDKSAFSTAYFQQRDRKGQKGRAGD